MRDCPKCGAQVDGIVCSVCGEGKPVGKKGATTVVQRRRLIERDGHTFNMLLCDHVDRGQECSGIAVWSPSTTGSGPWYCRQHATPSGSRGTATSPPRGFQTLRNLVRQKKFDPEAIAERQAIQGEAA